MTAASLTVRQCVPADFVGSLTGHESKHAPAVLYVAGQERLLTRGPRIAVVGSRNASTEGIRRCEVLVRHLVDAHAVVVSGLAKGIDTVAHQVALDLGGDTMAVVGTPLDVVSPAENRKLFQRIVSTGIVVSQFAPGTPVGPKNFVMRNRTMALLSDATVIVEAGAKSGTEHQGWEALRLGRVLFVMESVLSSEGGHWAQKLVDYGAQVLMRENLEYALREVPNLAHAQDIAF